MNSLILSIALMGVVPNVTVNVPEPITPNIKSKTKVVKDDTTIDVFHEEFSVKPNVTNTVPGPIFPTIKPKASCIDGSCKPKASCSDGSYKPVIQTQPKIHYCYPKVYCQPTIQCYPRRYLICR